MKTLNKQTIRVFQDSAAFGLECYRWLWVAAERLRRDAHPNPVRGDGVVGRPRSGWLGAAQVVLDRLFPIDFGQWKADIAADRGPG